MAIFRADYSVDTIFDVTGETLRRRGITLLLADLDNTLAPYGQREPDPAVCRWRDELAAAGVTLYILSNSRKPDRVDVFAAALKAPFRKRSGKPGTKTFFSVMEEVGVAPEQTAIIGDQIFTDTVGGNRAGVTTILVKPIRWAGNPGRYVRYAAELPFRWASGRRGLC